MAWNYADLAWVVGLKIYEERDGVVADKGLHLQNIIAIIWDFDKTLSPAYMQGPLFAEYAIDEKAFWDEVNALPAYYARAGVTVQRDTCYLGHLLTYVASGRMPGLGNAKLEALGAQIDLFDGVCALFDRLDAVLEDGPYREGDLRVEHHVVSTGLAAMIRGSRIASRLSGIWASEFIETPAVPGFDPASPPRHGEISQIATIVDNTAKTRAIFEINKGTNARPNIGVNDLVQEEDRRVPMKNMIYVADGPSDIPSFSVVRKHGGLAYAVYEPTSEEQYARAVDLQKSGRVDDYGPADYTAASATDRWLRLHVREIADRIMEERNRALDARVKKGHIDHLE
jgi:hypothetical protein